MELYLFKYLLEIEGGALVEWLTFIVLWITLVVLGIYTKFTYNLQNEAKDQNKLSLDQIQELISQRRLSIMPALIHNIELDDDPYKVAHNITLKNIGNGNAANIQISKIDDPSPNKKGYFVFKNILCLEVGQEVKLEFDYIENVNGRTKKAMAFDSRCSLESLDFSKMASYDVFFKFQDIEGNRLQQSNTVVEGKNQIGSVKQTTSEEVTQP
ncbi:MAG: hypothetical protein HUN04_19845 [Desulfobacter sp.]|nr:MAG: hypothetical protein HUN04_19845 [Desulfobacter sp.]